MSGPKRTRSWWGWGYDEDSLSKREIDSLARMLAGSFQGWSPRRIDPPAPADLSLPSSRLHAPSSLETIVSSSPRDRASHAYGCSYRDVVRALRGQIDHPPDLVARPTSERDVEAILDWCATDGIAVVPYGGGTSVVGGVEPDVGDAYRGTVTLDLERLGRVVEVDELSRAARIQGGALGPSIEEALRPIGMTLRHFPQSFECSTLGGWIATRAAGHFATGPTHIDDLVESLRVVTPVGVLETRRLPASGAGPSPDGLFIGSEGILGVITEAWVRVRERPTWRSGGAVKFASFDSGVAAVRALSQSGLEPSNCRLIDPVEAMVSGTGDGSAAILVVGFESADHPVEPLTDRALEIVQDHGGLPSGSWGSRSAQAPGGDGSNTASDERDEVQRWKKSFLRAPYLRDAMVRLGTITETFETAVTWERFDELYDAVVSAVSNGLDEAQVVAGFVTCRFTHVYPDGPAVYFTVIGPATRGAELEQWDLIKAAAADAVLASGGTITHHHSVGRDHLPWYDQQRPELFASSLRAVKDVLDPTGVCNPGVLLPTPTRAIGSGLQV